MKFPCCQDPSPDVTPDADADAPRATAAAEVTDDAAGDATAPNSAVGAGGDTAPDTTGTDGRSNATGAESPTAPTEPAGSALPSLTAVRAEAPAPELRRAGAWAACSDREPRTGAGRPDDDPPAVSEADPPPAAPASAKASPGAPASKAPTLTLRAAGPSHAYGRTRL